MDPYTQAAVSIIKGQMDIIGPLALDQAKRVPGLKIISPTQVTLEGDKKQVLAGLVDAFASIFGKASVEVCKEACNPYLKMIPPDQIPDILKS
jgi:hypothetical protein